MKYHPRLNDLAPNSIIIKINSSSSQKLVNLVTSHTKSLSLTRHQINSTQFIEKFGNDYKPNINRPKVHRVIQPINIPIPSNSILDIDNSTISFLPTCPFLSSSSLSSSSLVALVLSKGRFIITSFYPEENKENFTLLHSEKCDERRIPNCLPALNNIGNDMNNSTGMNFV